MVQILKLQDRTERVETGSVKFEYSDGYVDWNGYFIRGDNFFGMQMALNNFLHSLGELKPEQKFWLDQFQGYLKDDEVIEKQN